MQMAGIESVVLQVVGGNDKLIEIRRVSREDRWPPLRVVQPHDALPAAPQPSSEHTIKAKRPKWALVWVGGVLMAMAQGIRQAIAEHYW